MTTSRSRTRSLTLTGILLLGVPTALSACGSDATWDGGPAADRRWQITGVFDDPSLPAAPADDAGAPVLILGRASYSGSTPCNEFAGDLTWGEDGAATFGAPRLRLHREPMAVPAGSASCSSSIEAYDRRLMRQLDGEVTVSTRAGGDGGPSTLRVRRPADSPASRPGAHVPDAAGDSGFAAIEVR